MSFKRAMFTFSLIFMFLNQAALQAFDAKALDILSRQAGAEAGLVVFVEPAELEPAIQLAQGGRHVVAVLFSDSVKVAQADAHFVAAGIHPLADAHRWFETGHLPFRDHAVNVLLIDANTSKVSPEEQLRVIAPGYGLTLLKPGPVEPGSLPGGFPGFFIKRKPRPKEMDVWLGWYSHGGGHMANQDRLAQPPNSVQFIGGPRNLRGLPFFATDRVLINNTQVRDAFSGVLRQQPAQTYSGGDMIGGNFSDGRHLLQVQSIGSGKRLPVCELLTGQPIHEGIELGDIESNLPHWNKEPRLLRRTICADRQHVYWRGSFKSVRAAHIVENRRIWEQIFDHPIEAIVTNGEVVAVLLVEDPNHTHVGNWAHYNKAVSIVGLEAATGRELWRNEDFKGRFTLHFGLDHGVVVAATDLVGPNPNPPGNQYLESTRIRNLYRPGNMLLALEARTGVVRFQRTSFEDITTYGGRKHFGILPDRITIMSDETHLQQYDLRTGATLGGQSFPANPGNLDNVRGYRAQCYAVTPEYLIHQALGGIHLDGRPPLYRHAPKINLVWYDSFCKPANGMVYYPPRRASSMGDLSIGGIMGMIARQAPQPLPDNMRLFNNAKATIGKPLPQDWPTLRGDTRRGAWLSIEGPMKLSLVWEHRIKLPRLPDATRLLQTGWRYNHNSPGLITQPVADGQRVLVALTDAHRVDCLDRSTGTLRWSTPLGGRITTPPTLAGDTAFVGCHDGTVSAINLNDGKINWTFMAASNGELIMAFEQVEGLAPVRGSPVVMGDMVYVAAGRHSLMEDGIRINALDAITGALRRQTVLDTGSYDKITTLNPESVPHPTAGYTLGTRNRPFSGNTLLQEIDGRLRLGEYVTIEPATLEITHRIQGSRKVPLPFEGDHAGGSGWIRPADQYIGYEGPNEKRNRQARSSGPTAGCNQVVIRADGTMAVVDFKLQNNPSIFELESPNGEVRKLNVDLSRFDVLQTMAGAGERLYLAGNKGRTLVLLSVDTRDGSVEELTIPAVIPSELGIIGDGMPVSNAIGAHRHTATAPDHEYIIPDGIAVAHGHVFLTTTAGRVLAFK